MQDLISLIADLKDVNIELWRHYDRYTALQKKIGDLVAVMISLQRKRSEYSACWALMAQESQQTIKMMVGLLRPGFGFCKDRGLRHRQDLSCKKILAYVPEKGYIYEKLTAWESDFIAGFTHGGRKLSKKMLPGIWRYSGFEWKHESSGSFSMGMKQRLCFKQPS